MSVCRAAGSIAFALALLPALGAAQAPPPRWRTQIDLGFVSASGNSRLRTLNLAEQTVYQEAPWTFTQTFAIVNGATGGVETANNVKAGLRADHRLGTRLSVYGLLAYEQDRFAGLTSRFEESAGLSYAAMTGPRHLLDVEAGAGRTQQKGATVENFWASRLASRYRYTFRENTWFEQKAELLTNLSRTRDSRVNTESSLVAPLSTHVALKLGYVVRFNNEPEPTFKKTDTVFSAGLQIVL